jgi:hypothetical protein
MPALCATLNGIDARISNMSAEILQAVSKHTEDLFMKYFARMRPNATDASGPGGEHGAGSYLASAVPTPSTTLSQSSLPSASPSAALTEIPPFEVIGSMARVLELYQSGFGPYRAVGHAVETRTTAAYSKANKMRFSRYLALYKMIVDHTSSAPSTQAITLDQAAAELDRQRGFKSLNYMYESVNVTVLCSNLSSVTEKPIDELKGNLDQGLLCHNNKQNFHDECPTIESLPHIEKLSIDASGFQSINHAPDPFGSRAKSIGSRAKSVTR